MYATLRRARTLTAAIVTLSSSACSVYVGENPVPELSSVEPVASVELPGKAASVELPGKAAKHPNGKCLPHIQTTGDWLAADGGRTIPLPNGTAIHLFGDTLLDAATPDSPEAFDFVGNSIGLAGCVDGEYSIDYLWRESGERREPFFDIGVEGVRVWPVDGFLLDGRLHVVLDKIIETDEGFRFDCIGTAWATIDNPLDAPRDWRIAYHDFTGLEGYRPDKGITVHDGYVYLFSGLLKGDYPQPAILLRVPQGGLDAPAQHLEYLAEGGDWLPMARFNDDARIVVEQTSPNMYVHYHEGLGRFMTVHADPAFGSRDMVIQTAESLEGPWTAGTLVYKFPEMEPRTDGATVICYAVTEHPQLRMNDGNTIVATYACNTLDGPLPSLDDLDIYLPKTVTIDLTEMKNSLRVAG